MRRLAVTAVGLLLCNGMSSQRSDAREFTASQEPQNPLNTISALRSVAETRQSESRQRSGGQVGLSQLKRLTTLLMALNPSSTFVPAVWATPSDGSAAVLGARRCLSCRGPQMVAVADKVEEKISDKERESRAKRKRKQKMPQVAIVGRPNVGKSMIANRMSGQHGRGAIAFDTPGITRDRVYNEAYWGRHEFLVCDTGGIIYDDKEGDVFAKEIREQALLGMKEAAVVVLVADAYSGPTALDIEIATFLRRQKKKVILAVNKCESMNAELAAAEFWSLGLGQPWPVSGIHGTGMGELMEELVFHLPPAPENWEDYVSPDEDDDIFVAILGRPNTGKSTLLNRMTKSNRMIVSDVAGTTRDSIDQSVVDHGTTFIFTDTAGVRKRVKVHEEIESEMVKRALKAAQRSDVCLLVLDATLEISHQENVLSRYIADHGRACVVAVNKWDAVPNKNDALYKRATKDLEHKLPEVSWAKKLFLSAQTGLRTNEVFGAVRAAVKEHRRRVTTSVLNEVIEEGVRFQKPPSTSTGRQGVIYYGAQVAVRPPTFVLFCNDPKLFSNNYRRYLEKHIRKSLGFDGTPINIFFRGRKAAGSLMKGDKRKGT